MMRPPEARPTAPLVLWLLAGGSFAFSLVLLGLGVAVIVTARDAAGEAAVQIELASRATITTTVRISQTVPVRISVPISQTLEVPVNQQIPIDTVVRVQRELPVLGALNVDLPIKGSVPVNARIPIAFNQTVPINAVVPVQADVPISVSVADTPLGPQLAGLARALKRIAGR